MRWKIKSKLLQFVGFLKEISSLLSCVFNCAGKLVFGWFTVEYQRHLKFDLMLLTFPSKLK